MTLSVDVFVRAPDGEMRVLDVPEGCNDSAGPESWRTAVWGSDAVRSLGARFLPRVREEWLQVETGELAEFLGEVALLRAHLDVVALATEGPRTVEERRARLADRLDNLEAAALRARETGGGVIVW
ncbi:hypothetical protein [Streptomyces carpinensis]|uniref:Uncharacterized protein n=1 Tax=Streptomyces carpinensis TaxID=66369 RepID=A0ABV1W7S4_9ACTN|nr:hypothetical protein [Streptomyces carpinensis]